MKGKTVRQKLQGFPAGPKGELVLTFNDAGTGEFRSSTDDSVVDRQLGLFARYAGLTFEVSDIEWPSEDVPRIVLLHGISEALRDFGLASGIGFGHAKREEAEVLVLLESSGTSRDLHDGCSEAADPDQVIPPALSLITDEDGVVSIPERLDTTLNDPHGYDTEVDFLPKLYLRKNDTGVDERAEQHARKMFHQFIAGIWDALWYSARLYLIRLSTHEEEIIEEVLLEALAKALRRTALEE